MVKSSMLEISFTDRLIFSNEMSMCPKPLNRC